MAGGLTYQILNKKKKIKIAFAASRDLGHILISWIKKNEELHQIEIVGGVAVNYKNWWDDKIEKLYLSKNIKPFKCIKELIEQTNPDLIFSFNYWKIIPKKLFDKVPNGIINIHHSYKLRFRGRYSTSWAIVRARKDNNWWHGTSIHYINENLDEGSIILTEKIPILKNDTSETLFKKVQDLSIKLFKENFSFIIDNSNKKIIKNDNKYYFYDSGSKNNIILPDNVTKEEILDYVRAWTFKDRALPVVKYRGKAISLSILAKQVSNLKDE
ncbi:formyltransferase family protein [Bacteroidota bacterium]|nr:formyltransferase family protein [Bacteroidota bacterium]MDC3114846.1 formyltransferase family protein [Bacteroidota bacterium]